MIQTSETSTATVAPPAHKSVGSGLLFNGFFEHGQERNFRKDQLLDGRARRVFDLTSRACEAGVYPFQLPLQSRSGPWVQAEDRQLLMLSSYDYLGLIGDPRIDEAAIGAIRKYSTGSGGSRLMTGTLDLHRTMERDLADFKGTQEMLTTSSGYMANLTVIAGLFSGQDRVVMDALCHRSIVDACKLAGVQVQRFKHNDMDSLRHEIANGPAANRTMIISEGSFSMDGDVGPLPDLVQVKRDTGVYLMIDDSHGFGVLGKFGHGVDEYYGVPTNEVDIWTGSFAKAVPSNGGWIGGSQELMIFLQHAASPFVFSAAPSPSSVAVVCEALRIMRAEPELFAKLHENAVFLREGLQELGYDTGLSETPIIPVNFDNEEHCAFAAAMLRGMGVSVTPILFPAVPLGSARLRLCVTAAHSRDDLQFALDAFKKLRE
jgi:glycine C-acetyltransferase